MLDKLSIKDKLKQYKNLEQSIAEVEDDIRNLEKDGLKRAAVQESRKHPPFGKHDIIIEAQSKETKELMSEYKEILSQREKDLLKLKIELETFINTIPEPRMQLIFKYKHIKGYTWARISYMIGGSIDSIKQEYSRFLKEI
ncbi:MAG: hypothetical protein NC483_00575 [Ruminococcus sp.]|nr:hypothetical protein [Ruminococcus sp.]